MDVMTTILVPLLQIKEFSEAAWTASDLAVASGWFFNNTFDYHFREYTVDFLIPTNTSNFNERFNRRKRKSR